MPDACTHPDTRFYRTVCPEPCGAMHNRCTTCGNVVDSCTLEGFDGCSSSACRPRGKPWAHTYEWGLCAHAPESARPEPRVTLMAVEMFEDGMPGIGTTSYTLSEMASKVEVALRTVPVRLGPNALAILREDGTVGLSGGEYAAMALAVATMLAGEEP
jgi:hypothetical protein